MGLIAPNPWVIGKRYKVIDENVTGMYHSEWISITSPGEAVANDGARYRVARRWLTDGSLEPMKEEEMGLIAPNEQEQYAQEVTKNYEAAVTVAEHREVTVLRKLIEMAAAEPSHELRNRMQECINEKYRSTAYKKWFKLQMEAGRISPRDKQAMSLLLHHIRHCRRVPASKSYRYNWF